MKYERIYFSYLLRLWQVNRDGKRVWWASLEKPGTHERHAFTNLEDLFVFIKEHTVETDKTQIDLGDETDI